ncbi:hypothetical protein [Desnuesiella massiliensis]|uniref:hypothetical protein n=1 Tax=Desnuesiella massiliensis TaxID=1650662 RepID=UPI0006E2D7D9|nr:hypothetical protein [Desnuesiella massiliensis]
MKKFKRAMIIFLIPAVLLVALGAKQVQALAGPTWSFKITQVGDANRRYFTYDEFTFQPQNMQAVDFSGKTYNVSTKEVIIQTKITNNTNYTYVYVDGNQIGKEDENLIDYNTVGNDTFKAFVVKHLTPGKHHIEVVTIPPYNSGDYPKKDYLYVNVPVYEDDKIRKSINNIFLGNATLKDYEIVGIDSKKINNLNLLNERIKGKELDASNVQVNVLDAINQITIELNIKAAFAQINAGTATLNSYKTIGVEGVTADNLKQVNEMVKITRRLKGTDLIKAEIEQIILELPNKVAESFSRINEGIGTLDDYALVGAINVTEINLIDINEAVKGKDNSTLSKLQGNINVMATALSNINQGSTNLSYYTTLGITTVKADNIKLISQNIVAAKKVKENNLTKAEIQKIVDDSLKSLEEAFVRINDGAATLEDYILVGATNVTEVNLMDINEAVKGKDNSTLSKLQGNINVMATALSNINQGSTSLSYYTTLGITTVKADNIKLISQNIVAAKKVKGNNLTKAEIQKVVDDSLKSLEESFARINAGAATLDDYALVGAINVTEINLVDINEAVKGKDNSTLSKLQNNINAMATALSYINQGNTTLSYYTTLGITTVKTDNVKLISQNIVAAKKIKGNNLTKAEIQIVVDDSLKSIEEAFARINNGAATLEDYILVGATSVTEINLVDINEAVKGKDNSTLSKLQNNINGVATALTSINQGSTTLSYYTTLGITTVKSDNVKLVSQNILAAKKVKGNNLTKAEIKAVVDDSLKSIDEAFARINAGLATLEDYKIVGVTNVTEINLVDINEAVKGKDNSTLSKLQGNINVIASALTNINQGSTTLSYYTTLGITGVKSDNIKLISQNILAAKKVKGNNLTKSEIQKVVDDSLI